jgi:type I restriction enzyme S subunit
MGAEWRSIPAESFCASVRDGTHDSPRPVDHGRLLVTSRHITGNHLDLASAYQISQEDFDAINKRSKVDQWDVLVSMIGTVGEPCLIRQPPNFAIKNIGLFKSKGETEGKWLYYYLLSPDAQRVLREQSRGTTQQYIPLGALREFPVPVPDDHDEMRAIVHILSTLDDKIALNRRMNETLDAIARALFQSWFVDFDPVRANAEGHHAGPPKTFANLFPDSFEDSDLGEIPKGWKVTTIGGVCEVIDCLHSRKPERRESGRPLLQLSNIRDDGLIDMTDTYSIGDSDYKQWVSRMEASPGDCVITNVGRVGAVAQIPTGTTAALGRNMTGVRCRASFPHLTFLIECLLSKSMAEEIVLRVDSGTILDALNVRSIPKLRFVKPAGRLLEQFESLARPIRKHMENGLAEARSLAALRDALLPKLISGELRVGQAGPLTGEPT